MKYLNTDMFCGGLYFGFFGPIRNAQLFVNQGEGDETGLCPLRSTKSSADMLKAKFRKPNQGTGATASKRRVG